MSIKNDELEKVLVASNQNIDAETKSMILQYYRLTSLLTLNSSQAEQLSQILHDATENEMLADGITEVDWLLSQEPGILAEVDLAGYQKQYNLLREQIINQDKKRPLMDQELLIQLLTFINKKRTTLIEQLEMNQTDSEVRQIKFCQFLEKITKYVLLQNVEIHQTQQHHKRLLNE